MELNMKKNKTSKSKQILQKNYENNFMHRLFEHLSEDLSKLYLRRNEFQLGRSTNYCKIGALYFKNHHNAKELQSADSAFSLGVEFGINISIDAFNSLIKQMYEHKSKSEMVKNKIDIRKLLKKDSIKNNFILPDDILQRLKKFKKNKK
jgi:hypothetical protein